MKHANKRVSFALALVLMFSCFSRASAAQQTLGAITIATVGTVVEVFDADALAVRLNSGEIAYVKLLGVNSATYTGGLKYMQDNAFGRRVALIPDYSGTVPNMSGRWNMLYVYLSPEGTTAVTGREMFNQSLVRYGYAEADEKYKSITLYNTFATEQKNAKTQKLGMWGDGLGGYFVSSDKVNINTASKKMLQTYMNGTYPDSVLDNILSYRSYTPFSSVSELKFVKGMTKEIFDGNRSVFSVITNINSATEKELKTLEYATAENVENILKYRNSQNFDSLTELYSKAGVEREFYDKNKPYLRLDDKTKMLYAKPEKIVNINTASEWQLSDISAVGSSLASRIVNNRTNGYTLKTLMELRQIATISEEEVHRLSDNCHLYTDLNTALYFELESLFGNAYITSEINKIIGLRDISRVEKLREVLSDERYNRVVNHVYVDTPSLPERVNLNTANEAQLRDVGMTFSEAQRIISAQRGMTTASRIPFNVSAFDKNVALYTNINTASVKELRSLNAFSENAISLIVGYRDDQPFGSYDELSKFFEDNKLLGAYNSVKDFIVVR